MPRWLPGFVLPLWIATAVALYAQKEYGFDNSKSSGQPYLPPEESLRRMKVPEGFEIQLFAAEPMVVNPIAFTVDERGRIWVIESFEYPNRTPPGRMPRDRIVILEDTDGDGKANKRTVFAEGRDFPRRFDLASGIEVGYGGCFVGAPPYLWHLKDTDGDDRADSFEILLQGFGSQDTHETLNTFTWGPDGWLYGLHGIFTASKVTTTPVADAPGSPLPVEIDAGVWRYHPRRRKFEVCAEGTSNPWGMDFDANGNLFCCACVIPHLYHIVPGGIYRRQAGVSKNPYAYGELKEICDHTFHKESGWAHAGLLCLDTQIMPPEYRTSVIFGSIHGNCIKRNTLRPNGSSFIASKAPDFLTSGDRNFRPVGLRWGPGGVIYLSDWHDQNPCHQAKPDSWDYKHGRIYGIKRKKPTMVTSDDPLKRYRERAAPVSESPQCEVTEAVLPRSSPAERLRWLSAHLTGKPGTAESYGPILRLLLQRKEDAADPVIPFMLWLAYEKQVFGSEPPIDKELDWLLEHAPGNALLLEHIVPRFFRRTVAYAAGKPLHGRLAAKFLLVLEANHEAFRLAALRGMVDGFREHPAPPPTLEPEFAALLRRARGEEKELLETLELLVGGARGRAQALRLLTDRTASLQKRLTAIAKLGQLEEASANAALLSLVGGQEILQLRAAAVRALAQIGTEDTGSRLIMLWNASPPELRTELLTALKSRKAWAKELLRAMGRNQLPPSALLEADVRNLRQFKDAELDDLVARHWGQLRTSPAEITKLIDKMRWEVKQGPADAARGKLVFQKSCMSCHRFNGEGHEVGPALDGAERSVEYLLSNILDPNRVVGQPFYSRVVLLKNGKLVTGLPAGEDATSVTLKRENAVLETISKSDIEEMAISDKSLMPEGMGYNLTVQEFRDLISYLAR
jgi:putative membrane-bound dehydrogenase-like protein